MFCGDVCRFVSMCIVRMKTQLCIRSPTAAGNDGNCAFIVEISQATMSKIDSRAARTSVHHR